MSRGPDGGGDLGGGHVAPCLPVARVAAYLATRMPAEDGEWSEAASRRRLESPGDVGACREAAGGVA